MRASNSYLIFCTERRLNHPEIFQGLKSREATKVLAEEWKKHEESVKEEYKIKSKIVENERKLHHQMIFQQENGCTVQFWNTFNVPVAVHMF